MYNKAKLGDTKRSVVVGVVVGRMNRQSTEDFSDGENHVI